MTEPIIKYPMRPMRVQVMPGSAADRYYSALRGATAKKRKSAASSDLIFRGGKTVAQMQYKNFYLGGAASWGETDVQLIEKAILTAMTHKPLNNVMAQYFPGRKMSCDMLAAQILETRKPRVVSEGDIVPFIKSLLKRGTIPRADLDSTIFNFLLPSGSVLSDASEPTGSLEDVAGVMPALPRSGSSLQGLGGFHGSVHVNSKTTIYYSLDVYSEVLPSGRRNGLAVLAEPWKNVVATLYHELNEFRTDPDVDDVIRTGNSKLAGWSSDEGEEVGDAPLRLAEPLTQVIHEVKVVPSRRATVPVQLQYSNAVHRAEGPIDRPHPAPKPEGTSK